MSTSPSSKRQADLELFSGWGKGSSSAARVAHVETQEDLERAVMSARESSTPILARGLGRSYGDAAQCAGGILLDCTALDRVIEADFDAGLLRVEAGISLDSVLRLVVPRVVRARDARHPAGYRRRCNRRRRARKEPPSRRRVRCPRRASCSCHSARSGRALP